MHRQRIFSPNLKIACQAYQSLSWLLLEMRYLGQRACRFRELLSAQHMINQYLTLYNLYFGILLQLFQVLNRGISPPQTQHMYDLIPTQRRFGGHLTTVSSALTQCSDYEMGQMAKAQGRCECVTSFEGTRNDTFTGDFSPRPQIRSSSYSEILKSFSSHHPTQLDASSSSLQHFHSPPLGCSKATRQHSTQLIAVTGNLKNGYLHSTIRFSDELLHALYLRWGSKWTVGSLQERRLSYRVVPLEVRWYLV